jgi:hypothetical protein
MGPQGYGSVYIDDNDLSGGWDLSSLQYVDEIYIDWNDGLTTIPSMPKLPEWINIDVYGNSALEDLDGFSTVTKAWGFRISWNGALTDFSGLSNLTELGGDGLEMYDNDVLADITLPALTTVEGNFRVAYHNVITSISAPLLTSVGVSGHELRLSYDPNLSTASFPLLTTINGSLQLTSTALANVNGFSALTSDLYNLSFNYNTSLRDLSGLLNLGDADGTDPVLSGWLYIRDNTGLTDAVGWAFHGALNTKFEGIGIPNAPTITGNN